MPRFKEGVALLRGSVLTQPLDGGLSTTAAERGQQLELPPLLPRYELSPLLG